jgi:hypothetical protein
VDRVERQILWLLGVKKVTITHQRLLPQENVASTVLALPLKRRLVHLYDQFGSGPPDPMYLPKDVSGIGDDQCRSLAWLVESVAHMKSRGKHYFEFERAQFFPERKLLQPGHFQLGSAVRKAVRLARSQDARGLPGYRPS